MQEFYKLKRNSERNQKTVYDVAIKFGGNITVSDIYSNTNLTIDEIDFVLADLASKNHINTRMDEKTSVINYIFPDIHKDDKGLISVLGLDKLALRLKYGVENNNSKPSDYLEKAILQTAQECKGKLGMSKIVEFTGLSVDDAQDVISLLCAKGICKMETRTESGEIEYYFPEIINNIIDNNLDREEISIKAFSKKALNKLRQNTDRMIIKSKVNKYKRQYKTSIMLDTFTPGIGHVLDKRWSLTNLMFLSIIPAIITAGLSNIPLMAFLRYQDASYYSLSQRDKVIKTQNVNRKTLFYVFATLFFYYYIIGIKGLTYYYMFLRSLL